MKKVIFILLLLGSCTPYMDRGFRFEVSNASSRKVWYYISYKLPDTTLDSQRPQMLSLLTPNQTIPEDSHMEWKDVIDTIPAKKLAIYFIDNDTLNKYDWTTIKNGYKILRRLEVSAYYLDTSKNVVTYR